MLTRLRSCNLYYQITIVHLIKHCNVMLRSAIDINIIITIYHVFVWLSVFGGFECYLALARLSFKLIHIAPTALNKQTLSCSGICSHTRKHKSVWNKLPV